MQDRRYYSVRTGKHPAATYGLEMLKTLFGALYKEFVYKDYFQEAFGYDCIDAGFVRGTMGIHVQAYFLRRLRKRGLHPIEDSIEHYSEEDLFDIVEFLYDHVSRPVDGYDHRYNDCGWHYNSFDRETGRAEYRQEVDELLRDYKGGYTLLESGEIHALPESGMERLMQADLPKFDPENVEQRVEAAKSNFLRYRSSLDDRRDAIRSLADVLEFLKPRLGAVLTRKDESDLFHIANRFGIRHHNEQQQTNYDRAIWYNWMFYYYLATIHAVLRLLSKHEDPGTP